MTGLDYVLFVKGYSSTEIAELLGVSPQLVSHWLKGRRDIPSNHLESLSVHLSVPPAYLVKEVTGQDRIELEIMMGSKHSDSHLENIILERDNAIKNHALLLKEYKLLSNRLSLMKKKVINYISKEL